MNRLGVFGASGKMGRTVIKYISDFPEIVEYKGCSNGEDIAEFIKNSDYIIDFSTNDATKLLLKAVLEIGPKPILIGTTALSEDCKILIDDLSGKMPIMEAPNMSVGANLQAMISEKIASILGNKYDPEIIDIHHKHKRDSPSGTALMLADSINSGLTKAGLDDAAIILDRAKNPIRSSNEISISSLRAGSIAGEHIVSFFGEYDSITIAHRVENRDLLGISAIKAVLWLKNKVPGKYHIRDMLTF